MLTRLKTLAILLLGLMLSTAVIAQDENRESTTTDAREPGWWTLGINAGSAYQSSDVCREYNGWGVGLTLAKNLYYKPGAPLSFDLRGRLLYTQSYGDDFEPSTGLTFNNAVNGTDRELAGEQIVDFTPAGQYYANHKTHIGELGLEGVFTLNRLRERTNWIVSLYGGLNLDWYKSLTDQVGVDGLQYDYSSISGADRGDVSSQLDAVRDGTFETTADGNNEFGTLTWMPSAGLEVGYQLTPRFSIHAGHKVTWSRTDFLDGQAWTDANEATGDNDIYHYTNLGFRWIIEPGEPECHEPEIGVKSPRTSPITTNDRYETVLADVRHINSQMDLQLTLNGREFGGYKYSRGSLRADVQLERGRNDLVIRASNVCGSDTETVTIFYEPVSTPPPPPPPSGNPPRVDITNPSSGSTANNRNVDVRATVRGVSRKDDIRLYLNDRTVSYFNYNSSRGEVTADVSLIEGKNTIRIVGSNTFGQDEDQTVVYYQVQENKRPPIVNIRNISTPTPKTDPSKGLSKVTAEVRYVTSKNDVKVYVNGRQTNFFSFNASTGALSANIEVNQGNNTVRIVGTNKDGSDEDSKSVRYDYNAPTNPNTPTNPTPPPPSTPKPTVDIRTPNNNATLSNPSAQVSAVTTRVTSKAQITFFVNGSKTNSFNFNAASNSISANVPLKEGSNTIKIRVQNQGGTDDDQVTVRYTKPAPTVQPPTVKIGQPSNNSTVSKPTVAFAANTTNITDKNQITLWVNGSKTTSFRFKAGAGGVTADVPLKEGSNTIKIRVQNSVGTDDDQVTVRYNKPAAPKLIPEVDITSPSNGKTFTTPAAQVVANVKHISSKGQVTFLLNGSKTTAFNLASGRITASVSLKEGDNVIKINVKNNGGSDSDQVKVIYKKPTPKPVVNITQPANGAVVSNPKVTLKATVKNVSSKSGIKVNVNGRNTTSFNYAGGVVTASVTLAEGSNSIKVTGTNSAGSDSDLVKVTLKINRPKPVVKFINPPSPGQSTNKPTYSVKANILHVTQKKNVIFKVNGKRVTAFNFNPSTGMMMANINLKNGKNNLSLTGKNESGSASASTNIVKKAIEIEGGGLLNKPTVEITSLSTPTTNVYNPGVGISTLKATLKNVTSKDQITIRLNGKEYEEDFTFNRSTGKLQATIKVQPGKTVVEVEAKTSKGSAKDSDEVTF